MVGLVQRACFRSPDLKGEVVVEGDRVAVKTGPHEGEEFQTFADAKLERGGNSPSVGGEAGRNTWTNNQCVLMILRTKIFHDGIFINQGFWETMKSYPKIMLEYNGKDSVGRRLLLLLHQSPGLRWID